MSKWKRPIVLASASPRRAALLAEYEDGIEVFPPTLDDGEFACGSIPAKIWVRALAVMKAQNVFENCAFEKGTILAADTVCVIDDEIVGQPATALDATRMIEAMVSKTHEVFTGWCLLSLEDDVTLVGHEVASLEFGPISKEVIRKYIATGSWQGKAGGYNLSERLEAKWPIVCFGDPTSVMGLPMEKLSKELVK
ncbi:MAG: Maf family protein [Planctomycetes bacterium]|nr:Maf family protein [Planctomycetota bacterium]